MKRWRSPWRLGGAWTQVVDASVIKKERRSGIETVEAPDESLAEAIMKYRISHALCGRSSLEKYIVLEGPVEVPNG